MDHSLTTQALDVQLHRYRENLFQYIATIHSCCSNEHLSPHERAYRHRKMSHDSSNIRHSTCESSCVCSHVFKLNFCYMYHVSTYAIFIIIHVAHKLSSFAFIRNGSLRHHRNR
ncbi:unnamed protein product [Albugo candida]|uniref:Uncharacterized protein n=1 Tax=Albugo candida TaxID=65357 RepID=A0A024G5G0_9STRA|nr:unnamed protein product [Albugo candida]|eukprot:CCI41793.1 unnamed protein product [Albugo candida]